MNVKQKTKNEAKEMVKEDRTKALGTLPSYVVEVDEIDEYEYKGQKYIAGDIYLKVEGAGVLRNDTLKKIVKLKTFKSIFTHPNKIVLSFRQDYIQFYCACCTNETEEGDTLCGECIKEGRR